MDDALAALHSVFGFAELRPGQAEILQAILSGEGVLAVMPTGAGKSLCYQLPAVMRGGLTIVVSPLIALMRDQVQQLKRRGIPAGSLNSANSFDENAEVQAALRARRLRLVYVAPERLVRADTAALLREAGADTIAIDEAHCVSQWGHDFRPEYMELREAAEAVGDLQVIAVTATADAPTRAEIVKKLFGREPRIFVRSFDRPNLRLSMQRKIEAPRQIEAMLARHKRESGIVYCASRRGVEQLTERLVAAGHWAVPYHAGMEPAARSANQDEFLRRAGIVVVATIAFGMGIDKPDVRFVCHQDLPQSIEAYYQEIGRAGRDGLPADTLTLYGEGDVRLRERQIEMSDAPAARKALERRKLQAIITLCDTPRCRRQTLLAAFGEEASPCGNCDICEGRGHFFDGVLAARKAMSALLRTAGRFYPGHLANILVGRATEAVTKHGHDLLPTFGVGREFDAAEWRRIYRQLQAAELVRQDDSDFGRWVLTEAGREVLAGKAELTLRAESATSARRSRMTQALRDIDGEAATPVKAPAGGDDEPLAGDDAQLFAALKARRTALAKAQKLPPYVIFSDRTLRDMARRRPRDVEAMMQVHGVGAVKVERYGEAFLAIIAGHRAD